MLGGGEASGPMHVHGRHTELVPPAGPDVRQLHPLSQGLRGKWHTEACYPDARCVCFVNTRDSSGGLDALPLPSWVRMGNPKVLGRAVRIREFPGEVPAAACHPRVFIPKDSDDSVEVKIS